MAQLTRRIVTYISGERAASMVEYALLVMLIAIVALIAVTMAGQEVSSQYDVIASGLSEAGS